MNFDILYSGTTKLAELIRTREASQVEVVRVHPDRIEGVKGHGHGEHCTQEVIEMQT